MNSHTSWVFFHTCIILLSFSPEFRLFSACYSHDWSECIATERDTVIKRSYFSTPQEGLHYNITLSSECVYLLSIAAITWTVVQRLQSLYRPILQCLFSFTIDLFSAQRDGPTTRYWIRASPTWKPLPLFTITMCSDVASSIQAIKVSPTFHMMWTILQFLLTHLLLMPYIWIIESGQHWFR